MGSLVSTVPVVNASNYIYSSKSEEAMGVVLTNHRVNEQ